MNPFSSKERDVETGLDYFGARYYSGAQGRFTIPDPLLNSGRPWEPQSWNRYSYVLNNPLAYADPMGLYDLNPSCGPNNKSCNKEHRQNADRLKKALEKLEKKLAKVKDPIEKARLTAALKALGTEGDHNGVTVMFGATKGGGAGETDPNYDQQAQKETYTVTLDPSKMTDSDDFAIVGAHEGTHIDNINFGLANPSWPMLSPFSNEFRAYTTTAYAASVLGKSSYSVNYDGESYVIFQGNWNAVDQNITTLVTKFHDKEGNKTHPETNPHNPWLK